MGGGGKIIFVIDLYCIIIELGSADTLIYGSSSENSSMVRVMQGRRDPKGRRFCHLTWNPRKWAQCRWLRYQKVVEQALECIDSGFEYLG